jgi:predicted molibdopterin-dependent oxidoreductase YjgC
VGIVVSAEAPNEEIYLLRRIGAALGARLAGISWSPADAFHDDFLIKPDKNPNTQGLRLQDVAPGGEVDALVAAAGTGELQALVLHRTDLTAWRAAGALERVPFLVVLDTEQRAPAQFADTVLPLATYAECDGTFTNHAGRVQRFQSAVRSPGEARPGWQSLAELLVRLGVDAHFEDAAAVFAALAAECPPFAGMSYAALGDEGCPAAIPVA